MMNKPLVFVNKSIEFVFDDGGRSQAGFSGDTSDCVTRSIAIATGKPYQEVYDAINRLAERERPRSGRKRSNSRTGVFRRTYQRYLESIGAQWVPTMQVGSGCKVHLRANELPTGRLIVSLSKHLTCVIDRVVHDTHDPSRDGTRCVYGYYKIP